MSELEAIKSKKEALESILLTIEIKKTAINKILNFRRQGRKIPIVDITREHMALIFAYFDLDRPAMTRYIYSYRKFKTTSTAPRKNVSAFIKYLESLEIDLDELREKRVGLKEDISKHIKTVEKKESETDKLSDILSFFNIPSSSLQAKLNNIQKNGSQDNKEYLQELYILRELFMAKAKGELATTQTETMYEVEEDEEGTIVKKSIYKNRTGKQVVNVRTQSFLPDEKSLIAIRLVDDMIRQVESDNSIELTEEELYSLYDKYKEGVEQSRILLADKKLDEA